jgi:hypothetical protein
MRGRTTTARRNQAGRPIQPSLCPRPRSRGDCHILLDRLIPACCMILGQRANFALICDQQIGGMALVGQSRRFRDAHDKSGSLLISDIRLDSIDTRRALFDIGTNILGFCLSKLYDSLTLRPWRARVNSTLKVSTPETRTLIDKIKAELKKRAETKAKRMLLKETKRKPKR